MGAANAVVAWSRPWGHGQYCGGMAKGLGAWPRSWELGQGRGARPRTWGRGQGLGGIAKAVKANTNPKPNPKAVGT